MPGDDFRFYDPATHDADGVAYSLTWKTPEQQKAEAEFRFYEQGTGGAGATAQETPETAEALLTYKTPAMLEAERRNKALLALLAIGVALYFTSK